MKKNRRIKFFRHALFTAVAVVLAIGVFWVLHPWLIADQGEQEVTGGQTAAVKRQLLEGTDEKKAATGTVSEYSVAPDHPRAIYIEKLQLEAKVLPMGLNPNNTIQAPINIYDAGWYVKSAKPGGEGAVFIDGHASGPTREGLFAYLDALVQGDEILVETGDGERLVYRVVHTEVVDLAVLDMEKALQPYDTVLRGMNLMTCTGNWIEEKSTYSQRVLVYTEQVS